MYNGYMGKKAVGKRSWNLPPTKKQRELLARFGRHASSVLDASRQISELAGSGWRKTTRKKYKYGATAKCATAAQLKSESEKADIVRQAKAALWDNYWKTHEPGVDDLFPAPIAYTNPPRIVCEGDPNCLEPAPF